MSMTALLSDLPILPRLVNGRVVLLHEDQSYTKHRPFNTVHMDEIFVASEYVLILTGKYRGMIGYASKAQKLEHSYKRAIRNYLNPVLAFKVGDRIHLHSINGMYTVVGINGNYFTITCGTWQRDRANKYMVLDMSQFKCLAGVWGASKY
jgi:hypothetical protein